MIPHFLRFSFRKRKREVPPGFRSPNPHRVDQGILHCLPIGMSGVKPTASIDRFLFAAWAASMPSIISPTYPHQGLGTPISSITLKMESCSQSGLGFRIPRIEGMSVLFSLTILEFGYNRLIGREWLRETKRGKTIPRWTGYSARGRL
jgi:hypothetical protein